MLNAIDFLPSNIKLFTKRVTNVSLNLGSGSHARFLALAFLMSSYLEVCLFLRSLSTVLRATLSSSVYTCSIECTTYNVVANPWKVFYTTTTNKHDAVFL